MFVFKDGGGNRTRRCGWESVPKVAFDARGLGKMFTRVLVRQDIGSGFMNPLVTAGMVEVPVGIDQLFDGIWVDAREGFGNVRTRGNNFRINQQLSVGPVRTAILPPAPKSTLILRRRV